MIMAKPTKKQMELVEEVSIEEDGNFYYLVPGWKREPHDDVHYILDAVNDDDYDPSNDARSQMKSSVRCDCDDCAKLIKEI